MNKAYLDFELNKINFKNITLNKYEEKERDIELAGFIKSNYDNIVDNEVLLSNIHKKIINKSQMIKDVLTYELLYYTNKENRTTKEEVIDYVMKSLKRYQRIVAGFDLEDDEWIIYDSNNKRFKINNIENKVVLYNTCSYSNYSSTKMLINLITKYIKRNLDLNTDYEIIQDQNNKVSFVVLMIKF